jgi:hypothetical protein
LEAGLSPAVADLQLHAIHLAGKSGPDDRDPYAVSHLGWGLNPQALWHSLALNGDEPERTRAAARTFPGNFLFSTGPNSHYDAPMQAREMAAGLQQAGGDAAELSMEDRDHFYGVSPAAARRSASVWCAPASGPPRRSGR